VVGCDERQAGVGERQGEKHGKKNQGQKPGQPRSREGAVQTGTLDEGEGRRRRDLPAGRGPKTCRSKPGRTGRRQAEKQMLVVSPFAWGPDADAGGKQLVETPDRELG